MIVASVRLIADTETPHCEGCHSIQDVRRVVLRIGHELEHRLIGIKLCPDCRATLGSNLQLAVTLKF